MKTSCDTQIHSILGSPRVEGDEEEDDFDDLDHEFDYNSNVRRDPHHIAEAALAARLNVGYGVNGSGIMTPSEADPSAPGSEIPLLTYGEEVDFFTSISILLNFA